MIISVYLVVIVFTSFIIHISLKANLSTLTDLIFDSRVIMKSCLLGGLF